MFSAKIQICEISCKKIFFDKKYFWQVRILRKSYTKKQMTFSKILAMSILLANYGVFSSLDVFLET